MSRAQKIKERSQRIVEVLQWRAKKLVRSQAAVSSEGDVALTFLIAHFNSPEFLAVTLDAIRKFHPCGRIVVADATSDWSMYLAAKKECARFSAEMHPLAIQHRHSGILNYLFRQAQSEIAIFLDQDCVLLNSLTPLIERVRKDILLAGPREQMRLDHPSKFASRPTPAGGRVLREYPNYIHASLMILRPAEARKIAGNAPFTWKKEFGSHPHEKYHGLCHQIFKEHPEALLPMASLHSAYGLGTVYCLNEKPFAYHNWFSGRVFKREGSIDSFPIDSLKGEMEKFLRDYWAGELDFQLPQVGLVRPAASSARAT